MASDCSWTGSELSLPNNAEDERTPRTGVVLDEIGLDLLAKELASKVLAPIGKLTHPQWTNGVTGLDSYHAFSIHIAPDAVQQLDKSDHTGPPTQQWKAEEDPTLNDAQALRGHIDICEISMNVCLGEILHHEFYRSFVMLRFTLA